VLEAGSVRQEPRATCKRHSDANRCWVGFTSIGEGIDTRSATGRLMLGILAASQNLKGTDSRRHPRGHREAKREGKRLGRRPHRVTDDDLTRTAHLSQHEAAKVIGVPRFGASACPCCPKWCQAERRLSPPDSLRCRTDDACPLRTLFGHVHRFQAAHDENCIRKGGQDAQSG
jgi:hypothetical protein